jgi:hypothetical protein
MKGKPFTLPITAMLVVMFVSLPINAGAQGTDTAPGQQPPVNSSDPSVNGTAVDGQTLTANAGDWSGVSVTYSYQWQRCNTAGDGCSSVDGAVDSTYGLGSSDVGSTLRVVVTASNKNGSLSAVSTASGVVGPVPAPAPSPVPSTPPPTNTPSTSAFFNGDFNTCDLSQWPDVHDAWLNASSPGFVVGPSPSSNGCAARVNVTNQESSSTSGDGSYLWEGNGTNSYQLPWLQNGSDTWYRMQVLFPDGANPAYPGKFTPSVVSSGWDIVEEWHSASGAGYSTTVGVWGSSPPCLMLRVVGGDASNQAMEWVNQQDGTDLDVPLKYNHWYDILVHSVYGTTAQTGSIEWYVDGVLQYAAHVPTITYLADGSVPGVSHEVGLYRGPSRTDTDTIYIDGVADGPSRTSVGG